MKILRYATEEEVKKIAPTSDLDETCTVIAWDSPKGTFFAVLRFAPEVDPAIIPDGADDRLKHIFFRDLETFLLARGVGKYYFNVHADEVNWRKVVENWGAETTSLKPEFRYKKRVL